jgi:acyl-CoA hydrolase
MDDVVGWTAFHVTGRCRPWSGYTVQVNVTLKRPVAVGSYLTVCGHIVKWEGRKVWVQSKLVSTREDEDESSEEIVHCTAEGLVILMKDV